MRRFGLENTKRCILLCIRAKRAMKSIVTQQAFEKNNVISIDVPCPFSPEKYLTRVNNTNTVLLQMSPQGAVCGNEINGDSTDIRGSTYASKLSPTIDCNKLDADVSEAGTPTPPYGLHIPKCVVLPGFFPFVFSTGALCLYLFFLLARHWGGDYNQPSTTFLASSRRRHRSLRIPYSPAASAVSYIMLSPVEILWGRVRVVS